MGSGKSIAPPVFVKGSLLRVNLPTILLALSMFATGACGLVSEYILSIVSTYILGNSIQQFTIIIAVMLFMMGIGSILQKNMKDSCLIEKFILLEITLALLIGFSPIAIYGAFAVLEYHFHLILYFFVASIGFLIGYEIPLALRINETYQKQLKVNISSIMSADYIGSLFGALLFTYILLRTFPLTEISFIMAFGNFAIAILTFIFFFYKGFVRYKIKLIIVIIFTAAALFYGFTNNRTWNNNLEQKMYDALIVFAKTTKYQRLVVTHRKDINEYRFFINGNIQFSSIDEKIYHEQLVHPVMNLVPEHLKVLILGGGDGLALREVLKYDDVKQVTLVDLDPDITDLFSTNPVLTELNNNSFADARVSVLKSGAIISEGRKPIYQETGKINKDSSEAVERIAWIDIINIDADKFIGEIKGYYNVVIIDFPDPSSIELAKLYSKEFYLKLHNVLAENGMFVVQSTSPYYAKESYLCIDRTIKAARFNTILYHDNVPSFGDWGFILGWKNSKSEKYIKLKIKNLTFNIETDYLTDEVFRKALVFGKGWLKSEHNEINTLMDPKLYQFYLHESWKID